MSWESFLPGKGPKPIDPIPLHIRRFDVGAPQSSSSKSSSEWVANPSHQASREKRRRMFVPVSTLPTYVFSTPAPPISSQPKDVLEEKDSQELSWIGPTPWILGPSPPESSLSPAGKGGLGSPFAWNVSMPLSVLQLWKYRRARALHQVSDTRTLEEKFTNPMDDYEPQDCLLDQLVLYFWYWVRSSQKGRDAPGAWLMDASVHTGRKVWAHLTQSSWSYIHHILRICTQDDQLTSNIQHYEALHKTHPQIPLPPLEGAGVFPLVSEALGGVDPLTRRDRFITAMHNLQWTLLGEATLKSRTHQNWVGQMHVTVGWNTLLETVTCEADLDCFFKHVSLMSSATLDRSVFVNLWDEDWIGEMAHTLPTERWVGNSSCFLSWPGTSKTPDLYAPCTFIWENQEKTIHWCTPTAVLGAAKRQGWVCAQQWNLQELVQQYPARVSGHHTLEVQKPLKKGKMQTTSSSASPPTSRKLDITSTEWEAHWSKNEWMTLRMMQVLEFRTVDKARVGVHT